MNLLALDTSSDACSVALQISDEVFERHVVQAKVHTNILMPMIRELLQDADAEIKGLDAIVLGNGPGSFIGMRIAASVAQGLAFGLGTKIVTVSSMAAVAAEVIDNHAATDVIVAQDARMNEVYLGVYHDAGNGLAVACEDETLQAVGKIEDLPDAVAAGKAWQKYPGLFELNRKAISEVVDVHYPRAGYVLRLGASKWQRGQAIEPENLTPAYIRMKVAEKPRGAAG